MTLPVTPMKAVVGKFLAGTAFIGIMLVPTLIYLVSIIVLGSPDFGPIIGGYIGAVLLGGAYTSIGLLTSSLSKSQIIALITGLAACFFFWFLGWIVVFLPSWLGFLEYLSSDFHFKNISRGIIDSRNIIYFLSIIVISLLLTAKILEKRR
jgi:ABC-2 type transport system permease protein